MRIGYAQLNTTVGDLDGNLALGMDAYEQLCGQGVDLIIFPELFLCGYPPRDLLHKQNFLPDVQQALLQFARQVGPTPVFLGARGWLKDLSINRAFLRKFLKLDFVSEERNQHSKHLHRSKPLLFDL